MRSPIRHPAGSRLLLIPCAMALLALPILAFTGCEDVIEVDLHKIDGIVIEGSIFNNRWPPTFFVSRPTDYNQSSIFEPVSNAEIVVNDDSGNVYAAWESYPGVYRLDDMPLAVSGKTYHAVVTVGDVVYEATTTMRPAIPIDSIRAIYEARANIDGDSGYRIHAYFHDPPDREDYAQLRLEVNDKSYTLFTYNGRFRDGKSIDYDDFTVLAQEGSWIVVDLRAIDRSLYEYLDQLYSVSLFYDATTAFDASPSNPISNWSNGALGYFGAFNETGMAMRVNGGETGN